MATLCFLPSAAAQGAVPTVTFVEGTGTIVSGSTGTVPAAGVRLRQCDIVRTGPQALVQVELDDGSALVIGPDSQVAFALPHSGAGPGGAQVGQFVGPQLLISGWLKLTVPRRAPGAPPHRIDTPHFGLLVDSGVAVLRMAADAGELFVEQGSAIALAPAGQPAARVEVASGRTYARKRGQERGAVTDGVPASFVQGMPRSLRDTLPSMLAQLKARDVQARPAPGHDPTATDAWVKSIAELKPCIADLTLRDAQEALHRMGIQVGPIDGILGPRTQAALREFQQQHGLAPSGRLDEETMRRIGVRAVK
jgi:hypothetical protein